MFATPDTFLTTVDRFADRLVPLNRVISTLADRFVPQATAEATCGGAYLCESSCEVSECCNGAHSYHYNVYAHSKSGCEWEFLTVCKSCSCNVCAS